MDGQILQANFIVRLDRRAERQKWGGTDTMVRRWVMGGTDASTVEQAGMKTNRKNIGRKTGRLNLFFNPSS